jgi:tetratricopeptide (TPR) repeat protein
MLLGRYFLDRTTRDDTTRAIGYFRDALEIDPEFALCWAELAHAYAIEAGRAWVPTREGFARAREAATRALSIEPNLAEGHAQLGRVHAAFSRDFAAAEASYRQAIELAPGSALVLDGASILAYKMGRLNEAIELNRRVLERDPLSAAFWHNLGLAAHAAGSLQESAMAFRRALELVPHRFVSRALLALVLLEMGNSDEALKQASAESDEFWSLWALTVIQYSLGKTQEGDELFKKVMQLADGNAYQIAEIYAVRGMPDEAFEWLDIADRELDAGILHAKVNPRFRNLREDSRWTPLLTRIGF